MLKKSKRKLKEYVVLCQKAPYDFEVIFTLDNPVQYVYVQYPLVRVQVKKREGEEIDKLIMSFSFVPPEQW